MVDLCLWHRTHESQSQRLSSSSDGLVGVMVVITVLHFCILSFCFCSNEACADKRALSSMASFLRSLCLVDLIVCFFWLTLDSQVNSSSVWPWGTLEFARKLSQGWDFLAMGSSSVRMVMMALAILKEREGRGEVPRKLDTNENVSNTENALGCKSLRLSFHESRPRNEITGYYATHLCQIMAWSLKLNLS